MKCVICGDEIPEGSSFCPFCGSSATTSIPPQPDPVAVPEEPPVLPQDEVAYEEEKVPKKKATNPIVNVLLRIASVLLSILLSISVVATILSIDLKLLTSEATVERVLDSVLEDHGEDDNSFTAKLQEELVDIVYDTLKKKDKGKITATKEQVSEFMAKADADKLISDKISGLMNDLINGTDDTHIRSKDVIRLLEDNEELVEETLGKQVDSKMKQDIQSFMDDQNIDRKIHKEIFPAIRKANLGGILSVSAILDLAQTLTATTTVILLILLDLVLIGLILLAKRLRISAAMRSSGRCLTGIGAGFTVFTLIAQFLPLPFDSRFLVLLRLPASIIAPVHYTVLGLGIALLIGSLIARIVERRSQQ